MSSNTTATTAMPSPNTDPRVVVTAHDPSGTAIFSTDTTVPLFRPMGPAGSSFAVFDVRDTVPVDNATSAQAYPNTIPRCPPAGVLFCISNIAPNFTVPMHRTLSIDYAVILSGEIVMRLESGEERTVRAGEFIVQGGVNHQWINRTDEPCRFMCVSVGAEKVKLADGTELDEVAVKR
jgi:mannose-6-phosphate isomerase-like protein (cupin superfamily)